MKEFNIIMRPELTALITNSISHPASAPVPDADRSRRSASRFSDRTFGLEL
jgi:hypothetical protein